MVARLPCKSPGIAPHLKMMVEELHNQVHSANSSHEQIFKWCSQSLYVITVEEFTEEDAEELEEVFKKSWAAAYEYPAEWRKKRQITKEKIIQEMNSGYHFFGVRTKKGKIIGVYKLKITEEGCFGEHQSILPEYTGEGIASAMYEQFIEYAQTHNCTRNYVNILITHKACIRLVEKYGFSKTGDIFEQAKDMKVQQYERVIT